MMNLSTFRHIVIILAALVCAAGIITAPSPSEAFIVKHGTTASSSGNLVTSFALVNKSSSPIPAGTVMPSGGLAIPGSCTSTPSACIAAGTAPTLQLHSDGAPVPYSMTVNQDDYADGSMQFAPILVRTPEAIPAMTNYTVKSTGYTYSLLTGQLFIPTTAAPVVSAPSFVAPTVAVNLTGTGIVSQLNQEWRVISTSSGGITLQGPPVAGSFTITGGTVSVPTWQQVDAYSGGAVPAPSGRSLCDLATSGHDLNWQITGNLDPQLSGTWDADVNSAIGTCSSPSNVQYHYMTGSAGEVYLVRVPYNCVSSCGTVGAAQGQLYVYAYIYVLQDKNGGFYGARFLGRTTAPTYCTTAGGCPAGVPAPNMWSFSQMLDCDGSCATPANILFNPWTRAGQGASLPFTNAGGTTTNVVSGFAGQQGMLVQLTGLSDTTRGLSNNTSYWISNTGGQPPYSTTAISFCTVSTGGSGCIAPTASLTGTETTYPYICQWCSFYDAQPNGRYNYAQLGGSVAAGGGSDPDPAAGSQFVPNVPAMISAGIIPAYNRTSAATYPVVDPNPINSQGWSGSQNTYSYIPNAPIMLYTHSANTSDRCDLGPFTCWAAWYFFNQSAADENNVRTVGLVSGLMPFNFRDATNHQIPVLNSTSYSGMASLSSANFFWNCNATGLSTQIINPSNTHAYVDGIQECTFDHQAMYTAPALIMTGEPQYMDATEEFANAAAYTRSGGSSAPAEVDQTVAQSIMGPASQTNGLQTPRDLTVNGTLYRATTIVTPNIIRGVAWSWRDAAAGVFAARLDPSNPNIAAYLDANTQASANAIAAYIGMYNATSCGSPCYFSDNGLWFEQQSGLLSWTMSYLMSSLELAMGWTHDGTNLNNFLKFIVTYPVHENKVFGSYYVGNFAASGKQNQSYVPTNMTYDPSTGFLTLTFASPVPNFATGNPAYMAGITGTNTGSLNTWWGGQGNPGGVIVSGSTITIRTGQLGLSPTFTSFGTFNFSNAASPYITSDSGMNYFGLVIKYATAGSPTFTEGTTIPAGYTLSNGDRIQFDGSFSCSSNNTCPPGGLLGETPYYVCNLVSGSFNLATDPGCSNIVTPTALSVNITSPNITVFFYGPNVAANASVSLITGGISSHGYASTALGTLQMARALGQCAGVDCANAITGLESIVYCPTGGASCFNQVNESGNNLGYPQLQQMDPTYWFDENATINHFRPANDDGYVANDNDYTMQGIKDRLLAGHP